MLREGLAPSRAERARQATATRTRRTAYPPLVLPLPLPRGITLMMARCCHEQPSDPRPGTPRLPERPPSSASSSATRPASDPSCASSRLGGGKGEIAIDLVAAASKKLKALPDGSVRLQRIGFSVPARLINQTVRRLAKAGIYDVGVIKAGHKPRPGAQVQVISIETLRSRKLFPEFDLLLVDESHLLNRHYAPWFATLRSAGCLIVGFCATPWSKGLSELYDDLVVGATDGGVDQAGAPQPVPGVQLARPRLILEQGRYLPERRR